MYRGNVHFIKVSTILALVVLSARPLRDFRLFRHAYAIPFPDRYKNYQDLAFHEIEGWDYRVVVRDLRSPVIVLALHGGKIEHGTSQLAKLIAGSDWSYYLFEGLKPLDNFSLHITSRNFDEPRALRLLRWGVTSISIHGFIGEPGRETIYLGGANRTLIALFKALMKAVDPIIEVDESDKYPGVHASNPVNLGKNQAGLQLELSEALRDRTLREPELMRRLAWVARGVMSRALNCAEFLQK